MKLPLETYMSKYVGKQRKNQNKVINPKTHIVKKLYTNLFAVQRKDSGNTIDYVYKGKLHATRGKYNKARKSKQPWEI